MKINGTAMRTIWLGADGVAVEVIDQTRLPFEVATVTLRSWREAAAAIADGGARRAVIGAVGASSGQRRFPNAKRK